MKETSALIKEAEKFLLNLRPLNQFLHLNMFPGLMDQSFWEAMKSVSLELGFSPFLPLDFYQKKYHSGEIILSVVEDVLQRDGEGLKFEDLFTATKSTLISEKTFRPLHQLLNEKIKHSLNDLTEPILIRYLSSYTDQGIALKAIPDAHLPILENFIEVQLQSFVPLYPVKKSWLKSIRELSASELIEKITSEMFESEQNRAEYIKECVYSTRGWASLIKTLEQNPLLLIHARKLHLLDFVALRILIEYSWIKELAPQMIPLPPQAERSPVPVISPREFLKHKVWQIALEESYQTKTITSFKTHLEKLKEKSTIKYQALFCIDDRECLLRRNIESLDPQIETFGTPGHFGLDFYYKKTHESFAIKSCPAPVNAKFELTQNKHDQTKLKFSWFHHHNDKNSGLSQDIQNTLLSLPKFFTDIIFPQATNLRVQCKPTIETNLFLEGEKSYTEVQAAERIAATLSSISLTESFADHLFILGHYSTTTNNPYFTAYGCGACSGRSGGVNAQIFAQMFNNLKVRELLKLHHHIDIPSSTKAIACLHDTTKEELTLYALRESLPQTLLSTLEAALAQSALERVRDFEKTAHLLDPSEALDELKLRAQSIFEPRPELGHTNNALCVVGDRQMSKNFSFNRRAFLQSYSPLKDDSGERLEAILNNIVPVCGGISLDYYFSRQNNLSIGAGSKLSHNIVGLIGLSNGTEDDLLTGLASQMVELHEPLRITFLIEQDPSILQAILKRNAALSRWFTGLWINLMCFNATESAFYRYQSDGFKKLHEVIP